MNWYRALLVYGGETYTFRQPVGMTCFWGLPGSVLLVLARCLHPSDMSLDLTNAADRIQDGDYATEWKYIFDTKDPKGLLIQATGYHGNHYLDSYVPWASLVELHTRVREADKLCVEVDRLSRSLGDPISSMAHAARKAAAEAARQKQSNKLAWLARQSAEELRRALRELRRQESAPDKPNPAAVEYIEIGVTLQDIKYEYKKRGLRLPRHTSYERNC